MRDPIEYGIIGRYLGGAENAMPYLLAIMTVACATAIVAISLAAPGSCGR